MSLSLAHSGQMMSSPSVINPFPAMDCLHSAQMKQAECQCRPSNDINLTTENISFLSSPLPSRAHLVPPWPVMGLEQLAHLLAKSSAKHSAQKGFSSRLANFCPARAVSQRAQTKHSWGETRNISDCWLVVV